MPTTIIESQYPSNFREEDCKRLGNLLKNRNSAVLIGMRRVGISNFLRYFLYHRDTAKTYIPDSQKHLFIPVDLNDLVEREIFPFWMLTLKRIVDSVQSSDLNPKIKKEVEALFLDSIQSNDLFLLLDRVRRSLIKIVEADYFPTIFLIRFDRIVNSATEQFRNNLVGLFNATHYKLTYVFTTSRKLEEMKPELFSKASIAFATNTLYIKPAERSDIEIISKAYIDQYHLDLSDGLKNWLFNLVDGYVQYMHLSLISLSEVPKDKQTSLKSENDLLKFLVSDERLSLQSEELWESLNDKEKAVLIKIYNRFDKTLPYQGRDAGEARLKLPTSNFLMKRFKLKYKKTADSKSAEAYNQKPLTEDDKNEAKYLWETGFVADKEGSKTKIFSPIFEHFLNQYSQKTPDEKEVSDNSSPELSKKEHLLFTFLQQNLDQICEREAIISAVWPEEEALGVSDWAIDRLIARLRSKLKKQNSNFEIITIKTRGYKLTASISQ